MSVARQDAWTEEDDLILAEVVLRHIREGSTQLKAFEEVGKRLSRTSAACGFRWNSTVRKQYKSAIAFEKKQRDLKKKESPTKKIKAEMTEAVKPLQAEKKVEKKEDEKPLTMERVLQFLADYHKNQQEHHSDEQIEALKRENERLKNELEQVKENYRVISEDYKTLLAIMERAKKLSLKNEA